MTEHILHLVLTDEDVTDLRDEGEGSINAMTQEGVEVIVDPEDLASKWVTLDKGDAVQIETTIIGQYGGCVPVEVTL